MTEVLESEVLDSTLLVPGGAEDLPLLTQDLPLFLNAHEAVELGRCESVVEKGLAAFLDVGQALWQIRQSRLYRESYSTFEEYTQKRWNMGKSGAYRLISAAEVYHQLEATSPIGDNGQHLLPANEAQARPLSQLPEHQRAEAWAAAVEKAGGQPTAAVVQEVVTEMLPPKPEKADAVAAPLFEVEETPAEQKDNPQSRFVPPGPAPVSAQGDMSDEEWEASAKTTLQPVPEDAGPADDAGKDAGSEADEHSASMAAGGTDASDAPDTSDDALSGQPEAELPEGLAKPDQPAAEDSKPRSQEPAKTAQSSAKTTPAPVADAAPALPAGMITTIVKEADFKQAQEMGLWPPAFAIQTVNDLEAHIKALDAREAQIVPAPDEVPAPPSQAMVVAGVSATRLAEINATAGTILHYSETQLLDELFPGRETTGPDHIVAVLVTMRLREMTGQTSEE